ncbi:uncharacterized protein [Ranitomeya imitator]|uniref:uncharacterized protein n=1 Tax=Ranitomeya imitator TaxID=111125 RepID=UPI0037E8E7C7
MPFGLTNAPAIFQQFVNDICFVTWQTSSHIRYVRQLLQIFGDNKLYVNQEKCMFSVQEILFLVHYLSATGSHMDPMEVQTVMDWDRPKDKGLQRFLEFDNYYRKFIKNLSVVAKPLKDMTRKGTDYSKWSSLASEAFDTLKKCFASVVILIQPDVT